MFFSDRVCKPGWFSLPTFGCYNIFWQKLTWHAAEVACQQSGGHLVYWETRDEYDAMKAFLKTNFCNFAFMFNTKLIIKPTISINANVVSMLSQQLFCIILIISAYLYSDKFKHWKHITGRMCNGELTWWMYHIEIIWIWPTNASKSMSHTGGGGIYHLVTLVTSLIFRFLGVVARPWTPYPLCVLVRSQLQPTGWNVAMVRDGSQHILEQLG